MLTKSLRSAIRKEKDPKTLHMPANRKLCVETLEQRQLLAILGSDVSHGFDAVLPTEQPVMASAGAPAQLGASAREDVSVRRELLIVDGAAPDYREVLEDLAATGPISRQLETAVIGFGLDGVAEVGKILARFHDLDALHIISHGQPGTVTLGSAELSVRTLPMYADAIQGWSSGLKPGADLLIYGCDVAANAEGRQLVDTIHEWSGADVAASDDATGLAAQGGDWDLEFAAGRIETSVAVSQEFQSTWNHLLFQRTFASGSYIVDMGQTTQTVGNSLKPYGLVYDLVANYKVPVNWAINPAKTTYHLDSGDAIPVDFTATITTGTKSYGGGSFVIDGDLLTPSVATALNAWRAQGVVIDQLAAPLTTEIYGQITSFPRAVLDPQDGSSVISYYANAGVPASSYHLGNPTDLTHCDDVFLLPNADPQDWSDSWKLALYNFVSDGGGLWAGGHSVSALESLSTVTVDGVSQKLNFLSNDLVPWASHSAGTLPYSYNPAAAKDPIMQIMNRLDGATLNGSEQIYVPTTLDWRSTTTVAVYDPDHPNNPVGGTSPYNRAAVVAYGNAFGDPNKGLVMYEAGDLLAQSTGAANLAAQRAFFNFLLTEGMNKAPLVAATLPTIVPAQASTITATISGGSGTYNYQWISANGVFSNPAGTWRAGDPPLSTQYQMTGAQDAIRLLITDFPCGRQSIWYANVADAPPTIDLDANNSSSATGADYKGYFQGGGAIVSAVDADVLVTNDNMDIRSAAIRLTTRPDATAETLFINEGLAASYGIRITSDGSGGFILSGAATLAQYQSVIASLQYINSLSVPTVTERVIAVTVNDGLSDSSTAVSRLSYLGGSMATVDKFLYLSDPWQAMDRVDPVATLDTTTSALPVVPTVSPNSTGMATWSNSATKNLVSRPWNLTGYGTQAMVMADGGSYITMASAASPKRNEAVVIGVTSDRHVSGEIWTGSSWSPIAINIGGTTRQNLGTPSSANYWGAAVAYETNSGCAMLVWNTGSTLNYSIWNGASWTAAASIPAYTGVEPRQIRIAANPLAASNEVVIVVSDKNEVDRALVWNGSSWGNALQLDNITIHNYTDVDVVYEQQSGRAMVVYASGSSGAVAYNLWNGTNWSTASTISAPANSNNYAQWTVVAADPNSNRVVLGVESNGKDAWMNVWSGTAWGTSTLGVQDGVSNNNSVGIAVAFESKSGEALAVFQNDLTATELQWKAWNVSSGWSSGTDFGAFSSQPSRSISLASNPYSDQIMLMVNDNAKILRSDLWNGGNFDAPLQLESNTNTVVGQPFTFFWDRYAPGAVTTSMTFSQSTPMTSPFVVPSGGEVKVTTYIQLTSGVLPAAPKLAVAVSQSGAAFLRISSSPAVTALGGGYYRLEWVGTMPNNATVPAGGQIALTLVDYDSAYSFQILYDSLAYPSQLRFATVTPITVDSLGLYGSTYPAGTPSATTEAGQPMYVRFTVSDPFGASDITGADLLVKDSAGSTAVAVSLSGANVVAATAGSKTYEYAWTPLKADTFSIAVTAHEGTEGGTATCTTTIATTTRPDLVVTESDGGAAVNVGGSVTYTIPFSNAGLGDATGVYITASVPLGSTFDLAGSSAGWTAVGRNEYRYPVGTLLPGDGRSILLAVAVAGPVEATLEQLDALVRINDDGTHGLDANPTNNTGQDSTPVIAAPDLAVQISDGGISTLPGGIVLYRVAYANTGTQEAMGVTLREILPPNTTFNSTYSNDAWDDVGGGAYALSVGNLPVGGSGTVVYAVTVYSTFPVGVTEISNTLAIFDGGIGGADLNPANNTSSDTTPISNNPQADLQITETNNLVSATPGNVVTYTITVTNAGPNPVNGAVFTDSVPASLSGIGYTTSVSGGAAVSPAWGSGNNVTGLLNLPAGSTVTYTVTGTLNQNATGTLTNMATILPPSDILDPNAGNNAAIDEDAIVPVSDLGLAEAYMYTDIDGSGTLTPGDSVVFTLTVTNSGPNAAHNVMVRDALPNGYLYVGDDAAVNGGAYSFGTGLWTIGTIGAAAQDNTAVLHIAATVFPGGTYNNVAEIYGSDSFDPDSTPRNYAPTEDDYQSVTPMVQGKSDLSLFQTMALTSDLDGNGILSIGDRVTFTLTVNNMGPTAAPNVHAADLLPAGYSFVSYAASEGGTYNSATGDWNIGSLNVLSSATLNVVATILAGHPASAYANYAQISASGSFDPDSTVGNNSTTEDDDASVTPLIADVNVQKMVAFAPGGDLDASGTLSSGDQVIFTVSVSNAGPDYATGLQLRDQFSSGFTYISDDRADSFDPITGLWAIGALGPGSSEVLHITATINLSGVYSSTAQVMTSDHFDPDSTPNNMVASEDDHATVTLTPGATAQSPVAVNDVSLHNAAGAVTLNVTANDTDPNLDLAAGTVDLDPSTAGQQTMLIVVGQGVWAVDSSGNVTFTPQIGFTQDPTPIPYTVSDRTGLTSNQATITIDYVPVATSDSSSGNATGTSVTVNALGNDTMGDAVVPGTVQILGTPSPGTSLVVAGQGTWTVNSTTGAITFTPQPGYTGDPTPVQYTVQDADGNTSNPGTVTVDYNQYPPVAMNDSSMSNLPGAATLNVTANDIDPNNDVDPATVDLNPTATGQQAMLIVAEQGVWTVDGSGNVTFTPQVGFKQDPTPIPYTVSDRTGLVSNAATITIDYVPVATNDSSSGNTTGMPVTLNVLANDTTGDTVVPSTIRIVGTANAGDPLVMGGQGTWTVNSTTGAITFTPQPGYTGDPSPIQYTVQDADGRTSNQGTVTIDYNQYPPVATNDLSMSNLPGAVTLNVSANDTDPNNDMDPETVDLDPSTPGQQTMLIVAGQGVWAADSSGNVTFTPQIGFTQDPTPIPYTVSDRTGLVSNAATITIDYVPLATSDSSSGNTTGMPVTLNVLANDTTGDAVVPGTVQILGTPSPEATLVVAGQGTWTVNSTTGAITFTPQPGYTGDPTPIQYTVQDADGNTSNPATVSVDYIEPLPNITVEIGATATTLEGNTATYTFTIASTTPVTITSVLDDVFGDLTLAAIATNGGNPIVVAQGASFTFNYTTPSVLNVGTVVNTVKVWGRDGDNRVAMTSDTHTLNVLNVAPNITVEKVGPGWIAHGQTATYKFTITNTSTASTDPVTVTSIIDDKLGELVGAAEAANGGNPIVVQPGGSFAFNAMSGVLSDLTVVNIVDVTSRDDENTTATATDTETVSVRYPPVANSDRSLANPPGQVTLHVTGNDTDLNENVDTASVDLNMSAPGRQTTLAVPGEGIWTVNGAGIVTFTPSFGFSQDPTPILYTVSDTTGLTSNQATITIDYVPVAAPNLSASNNRTGLPVTVDVLGNDTGGDTPIPSTVQIVGTASPGAPLAVAGQGVWAVSPNSGAITFTPAMGFTSDPEPIQYVVRDAEGNLSNAAAVAVKYRSNLFVLAQDTSPLAPQEVRVLDSDTGILLAQFVPYESTHVGGVRVAVGDVNGDGVNEIVTAPGRARAPEIRIFTLDGSPVAGFPSFLAYDASYNGGVNLTLGDVNGDGKLDIIAAPNDGVADVRIFFNQFWSTPAFEAGVYRSFQAFPSTMRGGAAVAAADMGQRINGEFVNVPDGKAEIVVGSGPGATASVAVFDASATPILVRSFQPFDSILPGLQGGVFPAVGRINADQIRDIVVGAGAGGRSSVEVWAWTVGTATLSKYGGFTAFSGASSDAPVHVAVLDMDGDAREERVMAAQGPAGAFSEIHLFDTTNLAPLAFQQQPAFAGMVGPWFIATAQTASTPVRDAVAVGFGGSNGTWLWKAPGTWTPLHGSTPIWIVSGDLDGNGKADLVVNFGGSTGIWIYKDTGTWQYLHPATSSTAAMADIDGDNRAELILTTSQAGIAGVWTYDATQNTWAGLSGWQAEGFAVGDFDGNGKQDVAVDFGAGKGVWFWNNNTAWQYVHNVNPGWMAAGDLDGNGKTDLAVSVTGANDIWARLDSGTWQYIKSMANSTATAADANGDGRAELFVSITDPVYAGLWEYAMPGSSWKYTTNWRPESLTSADVDGNGKKDIVADFGTNGLWLYKNDSTWQWVHSLNPAVMTGTKYGQTLLADTSVAPQSLAFSLTTADLDPIVAEAKRLWHYSGNVSFEIADLPEGVLGEAIGSLVRIDRDAAGYGWSLNLETPESNRMDLLTVVMHELGHTVGLSDLDEAIGDLMAGRLKVGARRN